MRPTGRPSNGDDDCAYQSLLPRAPPAERAIAMGAHRLTGRLLAAVLLVSACTSVPYGYYLTNINIPESMFEAFVNGSVHSETQMVLDNDDLQAVWAAIVAAFTVGGALGGIAAAPLADAIGRKPSLLIVAAVFVIGCVMSGCAQFLRSAVTFTLGRAIVGLAAGCASSVLSIFLSEIAPLNLRGFAGAFQELFIGVGKVFGAVLSLPWVLGGDATWPYLLALPASLGIALIVLLPMFPESPKFVRSKSKSGDSSATAKSIRFYHGRDTNVADTMAHIDKEIELVRTQANLVAVFKSPVLRRCLLMAVALRGGQELTGITAITNFSTELFSDTLHLSPVAARWNTIGLTVVATGVTAFAVFKVESWGRRPMLVWGLVGNMLCDIVFMFASVGVRWAADSAPLLSTVCAYVALAAFYAHVIIFGLGPGPVGWLIVPELVPQFGRSTITGVGVFVNWAGNIITTAAFLPLKNAIGPFSMLLFIIPLGVCSFYAYEKLPETKNRPVEEIVVEMTGIDTRPAALYGSAEAADDMTAIT